MKLDSEKLANAIERAFFPSNIVIASVLFLIVFLKDSPYTINHILAFFIPLAVYFVARKLTEEVKSETKKFTYASSVAFLAFAGFAVFMPLAKEFLFVTVPALLGNFLIHFLRDKWKISGHTLTYATFSTAFSVLNSYFIIAFALMPLVAWSRLKLKKHSVAQVIVGFAVGILVPLAAKPFILP